MTLLRPWSLTQGKRGDFRRYSENSKLQIIQRIILCSIGKLNSLTHWGLQNCTENTITVK